MKTIGRLFKPILAYLFVCLFLPVHAQQEKTGILSEKKSGEFINTGTIIAFGKLIKPPYMVSLDKNKITVNGIDFSPREKEPSSNAYKPEASEENKKRSQIEKEIAGKYREYLKLYDKRESMEKIIDDYKSYDFISDISLPYEGVLRIKYSDGYVEHLILSDTKPEISQSEKNELLIKKVDNVKACLEKNYGIVFGNSYTLYLRPDIMKEVMNVYSGYINDALTASETEMSLLKLTNIQDFVNDVKNEKKIR